MRALILAGISVFLLQYSAAQTGPGGVGNSTSNVLWLSADQGVYSNTGGTTPAVDGNNVGLWADRSGNGKNATHGTMSERPNLETNIVNGMPVIRFTAANGARLLSTGVTDGNVASVWAVASWSSTPSSNPGIIQGSPTGNPFSGSATDKVIGMWVSNAAAHQVWGRGVQSNGTSRDIPQLTGTSMNTFYSFLNLYNGANISQYVNSGLAGSVSYNGTLASWSEFGIGRQATESWNGDIAEVIAFNTVVNSAQRIIIDNYLSAKYNLPLSANDVYTMDNAIFGNFDFEVAGIGRVDAANIHNDAQGSGIVRILNATDLNNGEFLLWGHNNGALQATVSTGLPPGVTARFGRLWRASETGDVGNIDLEFDLSGLPDFASLSTCDAALSLRLLVDTDNDGSFVDQTPIAGATNIGGNIYRFANVNIIGNSMRFTLAILNPIVTGPAGVGSANGASTLKLWFRTDNGVNATGSAVDSWTNSAGVSELDISETGAQRPNLVTGAVNGFDEISFSGTNRLRTDLTLTTSNFVTDEASSFVVCRADNTTQTSSVYLTDPLEVNRFSNHIPWAGTVYYDIGPCCGNDTRLELGGLTGLTGYSLWSYNANPGSGKQLYRNGAILQDRALTSTYSSHATHRFNIGGNTTGSNGFAGDITEVIIFNASINSAQRILIENYLAAKYNLSLAENDIYNEDDPANGNFDYDVAGIGRVNVSNIHNDAQGTGMVRIFSPSNLGDNEFFMWGHDNGSLMLLNTTDVPAGIQGRLSRVWRVSETNATGLAINVGALDIQFDLSGQGAITASDLRLLIDHNGDGSFSDAGTLVISGATAQACDQYLFSSVPGGLTGLTDGDRFTLGTTNVSQTPLPIELESFSGEIVEGDARLKWSTLSELNNHYFTIERSLNGKDFMTVGEVPGSGTTKLRTTYQYENPFVPFGRLYYRLKQTDFDEAHSYSDIIMLENKAGEGTQLIAVPNPVSSGQTVNLRIRHTEQVDSKTVAVSVHDLLGRDIPVSIEADDQDQLQIRFSNTQASGIYIIRVRSPQLQGPLFTRVQLVK